MKANFDVIGLYVCICSTIRVTFGTTTNTQGPQKTLQKILQTSHE
jgi:hypothetical protein